MKQVFFVFRWIASLIFLILVVQNIFQIINGQSTYSDLIRLVGALAFGCMLFPPFESIIKKSRFHKQIRWVIGILFIAWLVLPFLQLDSLEEKGRENEASHASFEAVHIAAQKYCDDKGECAGSIEDLLNEGYLPKQATPKAGQRPPDDDPNYSAIQYYSTGNDTGCSITLNIRSTFGQRENFVKYCSVK